ncbi:MAG: hypothetical protein ACIPMY_05995 [Rickettsia endosymbiont of Pentastiridius leporinus]
MITKVIPDEERSLLSLAIENRRIKLSEHLVTKGAKLLPHEIISLLWTSNISDELLINCFDSCPNLDVNKPTIIKVNAMIYKLSLLNEAIKYNHLKLVPRLIDKGAKLFPDEIRSLVRNSSISDELLIKCLNNDPNLDFKKPIIIEAYGLDSDQEYSLLIRAIEYGRLELVKYLVEKGADVNTIQGTTKLYTEAYYKGIKYFEALVDSGKLLKDESMTNYSINLDDQLTLNLSDLYDVLKWKNDFNFKKFNNWFNNGQIHSFGNLMKAYKKFLNIKINYLKNEPLIKQAQDKYAQDLIAQGQEAAETIKKYFSENWQQSMLIRKNFDYDGVLSTPELSQHIGKYLFDEVLLAGSAEE